jgi:hypothetical protein
MQARERGLLSRQPDSKPGHGRALKSAVHRVYQGSQNEARDIDRGHWSPVSSDRDQMEINMLERVAAGAMAALYWVASASALGAERQGFYVGAGIGEATSTAANPTRGDDFEGSDTSFRLLAGFSFMKYFAFEAAYLDAGTAEDSIGPYALELETSAVIVSAVGTWPIGRWDLSVKLGYAFYDADQTIRLGNLSEAKTSSDSDLAGGLAAAFHFSPRYGVRVEYEAIRLDGGEFGNLSLNGIFKF